MDHCVAPMSEWQDRLAGSQSVALTQALVDLVTQLPDPQSDNERDGQVRLRAGVDAARAIVLGADANLVTARMIEGPATSLSQAQIALSSYATSGDPAQLTSANAYLEQALDALASWLQRPAREARQTVAALQRDAAAAIGDLRARAADLSTTSRALTDEIAQVREEIGQLVEEAQSAASAALAPLEAKQSELGADIAAQKGRLDAAIAQFQAQFSAAEAQRSEQFTAAATRLAEEHASFMTEQRRLGTDVEKELKESARAIISDMTAFREDARKVLSALGADATSGGFLGQAEAEHRAADRWRRIGVSVVVAIAIWGVITILTTSGADFTLQWLTGRLLVAIPLLGVGLYALSESGRHRDREWKARKNELDLAALDPFVALLADEKRNELKFDLAKRAFLADPHEQSTRSGDDVVGRLLDIVSDAVKRK